jgi:hypothetical protein
MSQQLPRTGDAPLAFDGELLVDLHNAPRREQVGTMTRGGRKAHWHRIRIYRLAPTGSAASPTHAVGIDRFLLHVVPSGFMRIRHYGILANRTRQQKLARYRQLRQVPAATTPPTPAAHETADDDAPDDQPARCPRCGGCMRVVEIVAPQRTQNCGQGWGVVPSSGTVAPHLQVA